MSRKREKKEAGKTNIVRSSFPVWLVGTGIGIICLVLGGCWEQFADIYRKAVMICMECIGLG